ncbi:MAG: DNA-binding protein WhiA [Candidatus Spyradocola sp.]|jgi:DNA-binding protein WhiA
MSFASDTRQELCEIEDKPCCALAELAALIHGAGTLHIGRGGPSVILTTETPRVARRVFSLCKANFGFTPELRTQARKRLGRRNIYQVVLPPERAGQVLVQTGLLVRSGEGLRIRRSVPLSLLRRRCCKHAYLRGAFLAAGTISDPGKGYHLEIVATTGEYAASLAGLLQKMEIPAKVVPRRESFVVYLKESEFIVEVLNRMGAHQALMALENVRITKNVRNNVNRAANCDNANVDKTMDAAQRQIQAILEIEKGMGFPRLPRHLREMAEKRLEYPETPMKELGECFDPPISKSAVNHRLRKLVEIAREMQTKKGE